MRIAHATDIHWFTPPRLRDLGVKRVLGSANLYLRGRRHDFSRDVQAQLVAHIAALQPDAVLLTGDLTAQALDTEFEFARDTLSPLLERFPTFVIPGNHDAYTPKVVRRRRMRHWFGPWMGVDGPIGRSEADGVTFLGLDPNRPTFATAAGIVPEAQLAALAQTLADPALTGPVVLAIHYPPVDHAGAVYDSSHHGLLNASALIAVLEASPVRPVLIACGHVHRGFRSQISLSDGGTIAVCNCGSSGHSWQPARGRGAAMAVYDIDPVGTFTAERYLHDGTGFVPEPGGAWQSAR